jgi:membrane-associated protein
MRLRTGPPMLFSANSADIQPAMTTIGEGALSLPALSMLLLLAAFIGDNCNYFFGKYIGPKVFSMQGSKLFNKNHLHKTHQFYLKHGAKAVIIARFIPIVRTFVPFVAGVGRMPYAKFIGFSLFGAVLWTQIFLWAGHLFGNLPQVKSHFHIVIFAVIGLSVLPIFIGWWKSRKTKTHVISKI